MSSRSKPFDPAPGASGDKGPIFSLHKEDKWRSNDSKFSRVTISKVACAGGLIAFGCTDGRVFLWQYNTSRKAELVEIRGVQPESSELYNIFIDPTGKHVLININSYNSGMTYYCPWNSNEQSPQAREIPSFRSYLIDAVAFSPQPSNDDYKTGAFLIGTKAGQLYYSRIEERKEKFMRLLWDSGLVDDVAQPIVNIHWDNRGTDPSKHYVCVLKSNPLRYFEFTGTGTVDQIFEGVQSSELTFRSIASGETISRPCPIFCAEVPQSATPPDRAPRDLVYMLTGVGIAAGRLSNSLAASPILKFDSVISYPPPSVDTINSSLGSNNPMGNKGLSTSNAPNSIATTNFYIIAQYKNRILAISRISNSVVWEHSLPSSRFGNIISLVDAGIYPSRCLVLVTDIGAYRIDLSEETRGLWAVHLSLGSFDAARRFAGNDVHALAKIAEAKAEDLFERGELAAAAEAFLATNAPLEFVCLKFLSGGATHREALITYLELLLDRYRKSSSKSSGKKSESASDNPFAPSMPAAAAPLARSPQRSVLCIWLLELHLARLHASPEHEKAELTQKLTAFLKASEADLDKHTALSLLSKFGRSNEQLLLSRLWGDWKHVVIHHINLGAARAAIDAIAAAPIPQQIELWYTYSSILMTLEPERCTDAWRSLVHIDPSKLIPALLRYHQLVTLTGGSGLFINSMNSWNAVNSKGYGGVDAGVTYEEGIRDSTDWALAYLQWVADTDIMSDKPPSSCRAVHNLLFSLYCSQPDDELLLDYIDMETADMPPTPPLGAALAEDTLASIQNAPSLLSGNPDDFLGLRGHTDDNLSSNGPKFDIVLCTRTAVAAGKVRASVRLYCCLGLYNEAMNLALSYRPASGLGVAASEDDFGKDNGTSSPRSVDFALAKEVCGVVPDGFLDVSRRLWLRVVQRCIACGGSSADALAIMAESQVLKVEDVLLFLPQNTPISEFRLEVSKSLSQGDREISGLRMGMVDYAHVSDRVRGDLLKLRNRHAEIRATQKCDFCRNMLTSKQFYVFPCGHATHCACVVPLVLQKCTKSVRETIENLRAEASVLESCLTYLLEVGPSALGTSEMQLRLEALPNPVSNMLSFVDLRNDLTHKAEEAQKNLDKLVANECFLCGVPLVDSISDLLMGDDDDDDWRVD